MAERHSGWRGLRVLLSPPMQLLQYFPFSHASLPSHAPSLPSRCILPDSSGPYLDLGSDCAPDATLANRMIVGNNTVYLPNAAGATVTCGKTYTMTDWLALGVDVGTNVADTPADGVIVGWARELLGIARA